MRDEGGRCALGEEVVEWRGWEIFLHWHQWVIEAVCSSLALLSCTIVLTEVENLNSKLIKCGLLATAHVQQKQRTDDITSVWLTSLTLLYKLLDIFYLTS